MLSQLLDETVTYNTSSKVVLDVSQWKYVTFQLVGANGTYNFTGTNDGGAVQGVTDGTASLAINFSAVQAVNLATGTATTSATTDGLYEVTVGCKYLQIAGGGNLTKLLILETTAY